MRLLTRKLHQQLPPEVENQIRELSEDKLTNLADTIFDLNNLQDLYNWLDTHKAN